MTEHNKYTKATQEFIASVAEKNKITPEEVIATVRDLLSGRKVSKHPTLFS